MPSHRGDAALDLLMRSDTLSTSDAASKANDAAPLVSRVDDYQVAKPATRAGQPELTAGLMGEITLEPLRLTHGICLPSF